MNWRCETADGLSGRMAINGQSFDLAEGNVFLVSTSAGGGVTQLTRDFSGVEMGPAGFAGLAKTDEGIRKFVAAAAPSK